MSIFRNQLNPTSAREKEVPPQEGQAVASLPGHEAEVGEQVLPISSGDKPTDVQASNITHTSYWPVFDV